MSKQSAKYIESIIECVSKYPAEMVAILPDNPGLYPLLGLRNPFSSDWMLSLEETSDLPARLESEVRLLNSKSGWLVLFQSYPAGSLAQKKLSTVNSLGSTFSYIDSYKKIFQNLKGESITCNSFRGKYRE